MTLLGKVSESRNECKEEYIVFRKNDFLGGEGGLFAFSRATPTAYGDSHARGLIRAVAAGLCQSHSNAESKPSLKSTPQLTATLDP